MVYLFKDGTMYVIDNPARVVHVLRHATLRQVTAHYADAVKQLIDAAANAPPEERAAALRKAADMKAASDRLLATVPRDYRMTVRFESVDGRACRVWEEWENGVKRPGVMRGSDGDHSRRCRHSARMETLSQYRQGSDFAFGVDLAWTNGGGISTA